MTEKLISSVFEKAGKESGKDSVHGSAEYLAEHISEVYKFQVSSKTLIRYYKKEYSPSHPLTDYLSQFLSYENYGAFLKNSSEPVSKPGSNKISKSKSWIIALFLFPLIGVSAFVGYQNGKEKCMIWKKDHFEKTTCSGAENEEALRPSRLDNFKKIIVGDTTTFFKDGKVQVWYDKSNNDLEFFSAPGIHPTNGKTLKSITSYIIEKHIKTQPPL